MEEQLAEATLKCNHHITAWPHDGLHPHSKCAGSVMWINVFVCIFKTYVILLFMNGRYKSLEDVEMYIPFSFHLFTSGL